MGSNYELEYINEGYSNIQTIKTACTGCCTESEAKISIAGNAKTARFYAGISGTVKQSSIQYIGINGIRKQI